MQQQRSAAACQQCAGSPHQVPLLVARAGGRSSRHAAPAAAAHPAALQQQHHHQQGASPALAPQRVATLGGRMGVEQARRAGVVCQGTPGLMNLPLDRDLDEPLAGFDTIRKALDDLAAGKFVVVLDDEDRENEGDLIIAADKVSGARATGSAPAAVWRWSCARRALCAVLPAAGGGASRRAWGAQPMTRECAAAPSGRDCGGPLRRGCGRCASPRGVGALSTRNVMFTCAALPPCR